MPRRKFCHCTEFCRSSITDRQRRNHYKQLNGALPWADSEDEAEGTSHHVPDHLDLLARANHQSLPSEKSDNDKSSHSDPSSDLESDSSRSDMSCQSSESSHSISVSSSDLESLDHVPAEMHDIGENFDDYYLRILATFNPWAEEEQELREGLLNEDDLDSIKMFKLKLKGGFSREIHNEFQYLFRDKLNIESEWKIVRRMSLLAQIEPIRKDCCIHSCMSFGDSHSHLAECTICHESRYDSSGKPRRQWSYLEVIPRLKGFFQSEDMVQLMSYRNNYMSDPSSISDYLDGEGYQTLRNQQVVVDGVTLPHKYFENEHDIAFSFFSDGYKVFRKRKQGPSATVLALKNLNLPPSVRTQTDYLIPLGLIPGTPKDMNSFLEPLQNELVELAHGVETYCAHCHCSFTLHGYSHLSEGDIRALEKILRIKGVSSFSPCRTCEIKGIRDPSLARSPYYCPLAHPVLDADGDQVFLANGNPSVREWDPFHLPLRSHESFSEAVQEISEAQLQKDKQAIRFNTGIKDLPIFSRVESQHHGRSSPHDWLHIFENVIPNLIMLWTGKFKGIHGDYELAPAVWEAVGKETTAAVRDIPSAFVRKIPNIATEQSMYTAESWTFWFMYLMPILLRGRFQNEIYYRHACDLRDIMIITIQFTITHTQIRQLRIKIVKWVRDYERHYFRYEMERLPVCTLTIHILLHIPDDILFCGPSWVTWTFYGERFCGFLQDQVKSRSAPYANLANRLVYSAYWTQIVCRFNLAEALGPLVRLKDPDDEEIIGENEMVYDNYPNSILRPPHNRHYSVSSDTYNRIIRYFKNVTGKEESKLRKKLPLSSIVESWGKVRIAGKGDAIRTSQILGTHQGERNNSFVRYTVQTRVPGVNPPRYTPQIYYGELNEILVCEIPDKKFWGEFRGTIRLLALITPCQTQGKDALKETVMYRRTTAKIITDLQTISAVVGRVLTRKEYGLIDRSNESMSAVFV